MTIESKTPESAADRHLGPLASFVRAAEPLEELTMEERERIRRRLQAAQISGHRAWAFRWSTALAALGLLLAGGGVFAAAGHLGLWPHATAPQAAGDATVPRAPSGVRRKAAAASATVGPVHDESAPQALPATASPGIASSTQPAKLALASASPRAARTFHAPPVPPATSVARAINALPHQETLAVAPPTVLRPPSPAPSEPVLPHMSPSNPVRIPRTPVATTPTDAATSVNGQAMLGEALRNLRNQHNPAGALDILAKHAALFPQSSLASERSVLEVEALLALARHDEALVRLDRMSLDDTPRSVERYVVRGELRARAQRWSEAGADFGKALVNARKMSAWQERALWGRAMARSHSGDQTGARTDLQNYLQLYPKGRFASQAARLLSVEP